MWVRGLSLGVKLVKGFKRLTATGDNTVKTFLGSYEDLAGRGELGDAVDVGASDAESAERG